MQLICNNIPNNHLPIPADNPGYQNQQNHPRHPCFSYSHHPNHSLQHCLLQYLPHLQPKPFLCLDMDCSSCLRQSSSCMVCTKHILYHSHILQSCISCPALYTYSESHHTGMVDLGQPKQQQELGHHPRSPSRTE